MSLVGQIPSIRPAIKADVRPAVSQISQHCQSRTHSIAHREGRVSAGQQDILFEVGRRLCSKLPIGERLCDLSTGHVLEAFLEGSAPPRTRKGFFSEGAGQGAMDDLYKDLLRFGCLKVSNAVRTLFVSSGFPRPSHDCEKGDSGNHYLRMKHIILGPNLGSGQGESG
jgi:hypothetical protein